VPAGSFLEEAAAQLGVAPEHCLAGRHISDGVQDRMKIGVTEITSSGVVINADRNP
jgi:hypothetical protein